MQPIFLWLEQTAEQEGKPYKREGKMKQEDEKLLQQI